MKLLLNLVRKDFMKNKVITAALTVFLIISTLFMAGGLRIAGTMIMCFLRGIIYPKWLKELQPKVNK